MNAQQFFNLDNFAHAALFPESEPVWTALRDLKKYIDDHFFRNELAEIANGIPLTQSMILYQGRLIPSDQCSIDYGDTCRGGLKIVLNGTELEGASLIMAGAILLGDRIEIGRGTMVEGGATIKEPTIIGNCTEVRQGAYIRGYALVGDRCVVGHATEIKHSIFLDDAKAGHFAYLGDSILGNNVNLGAGTKFANLKFTPGTVTFFKDGELLDSQMRKFGAILGDNAQTGCNSVTNPGTILGKRGILMPNTTAPPGYYRDRHRIR